MLNSWIEKSNITKISVAEKIIYMYIYIYIYIYIKLDLTKLQTFPFKI